MRELVGRLTALDEGASESLKVIAFFDELVAGGVGVESLLRGAAFLAGTVAGAEVRGSVIRCSAGIRESGPGADRALERVTASGSVWLERVGPLHANDEMVLERLGFAIDVFETRRTRAGEDVVAVAIDPQHSIEDRVAALSRLRLSGESLARLVVVPATVHVRAAPSAVHPTAHGLVRVVIETTSAVQVERAGYGPRVRADELPSTVELAGAALRLTDDANPLVDAVDLGSLLPIALDAVRSGASDSDVHRIEHLRDGDRRIADALAAHDSLRSAAAALGLHHSTVQARHDALTRTLGWDVRTPFGRTRYTVARICLRLGA